MAIMYGISKKGEFINPVTVPEKRGDLSDSGPTAGSIEMCTCCTCGYRWRKGMDGSHSCVENLEKYKHAFKSAKAFIDSHVGDPDITAEMCERYSDYKKALEQLPPND